MTGGEFLREIRVGNFRHLGDERGTGALCLADRQRLGDGEVYGGLWRVSDFSDRKEALRAAQAGCPGGIEARLGKSFKSRALSDDAFPVVVAPVILRQV